MQARTAVAALVAALFIAPSAGAQPRTERVSVNSGGVQENAIGSWWYLAPEAALSGDGRYVAFSSDATNLVRRDRNHVSDVFVRDRVRGRTRRVSLTSRGRETNGLSFGPAISRNGRYVAFLSEATNMPGVTAKQAGRHVFVRDRVRRRTMRVDVNSRGRGGPGVAWGPPSISADGRYVAFTSDAPDLVRGDHNRAPDAFVRDMRTRRTTALDLATQRSQWTVAAGMSGDGRYVAFTMNSPLQAGVAHVFLRDRTSGTITLIGDTLDDIFSGSRPRVSDDGGVVAFWQNAAGEPMGVVAWDRATGRRNCVSCWNGVPPATWDRLSGMSGDGRRIGVYREEPGLATGGHRIYLVDRLTGTKTLLSVGVGGQPPNGNSGVGALSADGRIASFTSDASNLVPRDTNRRTDVFVRGPL